MARADARLGVYRCGSVSARVYVYVRESGLSLSLVARDRPENVPHTRNVARARTCVVLYCMAKRGPMFSPPCIWTPYKRERVRNRKRERIRSARFLPVDSFRVSNTHSLPLLFLRISTLVLHRAFYTLSRSYLSATIAVIYDLGWWI